MKVYSLKIRRYNPDEKKPFRQESFEVEAGEGEKITYGLSEVYKKRDPSLSYILGCRTGHCGLCSMMINGKPGLACMESLGPDTELEPLKDLPVVKDLIIDREAVFQNIGNRVRKIADRCGFRPFELAGKGDLSPKDFLEKTNCILCLSCLAVCPVRRKGIPPVICPWSMSFSI